MGSMSTPAICQSSECTCAFHATSTPETGASSAVVPELSSSCWNCSHAADAHVLSSSVKSNNATLNTSMLAFIPIIRTTMRA
ncbi:MAG: hypothetical protein DRN91_00385 [Candidatus Alkanophagales archaeon]|nr:MAG: hypothetical protein DRN91_00385 [Candidatus Alkanophagales archaeon]